MLVIVKLLLGARAIDLAFVTDSVVRGKCVRRLRSYLLVDAAPDGVDAALVVQTLENSIASNHEEIEIILQFETSNLRVANDNVRISSVLLSLCLNVSKGAGHGEAAWEDAQRALHVQIFLIGVRSCLGKSLCTVDLTACSLDSDTFLIVVRLVITS